ncbi:MAG: reverse transcriptase domain-containing protein [Bacteroidales bacterium]|nr:reverse transcriptase domain-containing protein [Bacteroidales bacterium]MDD3010424.1 reverse transcriptase domain-containing protein [Bacteroidales bacterium]MDD3962617.1 reverse transcriptase domain-containing protein [Bacteroidales bacterium]
MLETIEEKGNMTAAYLRVVRNKGCPGVDGMRVESLKSHLQEHWFLTDIGNDLHNKTYRPQAIRRVMIDKAGSKEKRPWGIPTLRDRVVRIAVKMMIEPRFEADFIETSYGFRSKMSAHDAIRKSKENLFAGYPFVYDADLSKYFDTIAHDKLIKVVSGRLADAGI